MSNVKVHLNENKVHMITYGCQMNKSDSEHVMNLLIDEGFEMTEDIEEAGVVIFNTCTVRDKAEQKVMSNIGRLAKRSKESNLLIGMMGCVAQRDGEKILERVKNLNFCVGTRQFIKIPSIIKEIRSTGRKVCNLEEGVVTIDTKSIKREKPYQGWITAIRGCSKYCSYCIVPSVRGHEVSVKPSEIIEQAKRMVNDGVTEITLLGQIIERYGNDLNPKVSLAEILTSIDQIKGVRRLRFITSYPKDFTDEILYAMKELPSVCEHLHMPCQHGSDVVLKRMNRGYTREVYMDVARRAYSIVPNLSIMSDFICGFPGETEEQHLESESIMREADFQSSYIFAYSERPGTISAKWADDISEEIKNERIQRLLTIQNEISLKRNQRQIGSIEEVLVERFDEKTQRWLGRNRATQIVAFSAGRPDLIGQYVDVKISEVNHLTLFGQMA